MESEFPPTVPAAPVEPAPVAPETARDRHTREFNESLGRLEDTVEHGAVRLLKIAIPAFIGVIVAAVAVYRLGNVLRDRSEQRQVARAIRLARSQRGRRARAEAIAS